METESSSETLLPVFQTTRRIGRISTCVFEILMMNYRLYIDNQIHPNQVITIYVFTTPRLYSQIICGTN
jgi:hypothetical protein